MLSFFGKFFFLQQFNTTTNYVDSLVTSTYSSITFSKNKEITYSENTDEHFIYRPNHYLLGLDKFECYFIRKNKSFNKGRFSRNRQVYRTGVYFCFYINILAFYALWYYFYKFKLKFTYLW